MAYKVVKSDREIYGLIERSREARKNGSKFPDLSYEDGLLAALDWVLGETNDEPMEE